MGDFVISGISKRVSLIRVEVGSTELEKDGPLPIVIELRASRHSLKLETKINYVGSQSFMPI